MDINQESEIFAIQGLSGKQTLSGSVEISGSKNAVLPALASSLLFGNSVTYSSVPGIEDVKRTYELLESLGATVTPNTSGVEINTTNVKSGDLDETIAKCMRASVIFIGPLLARFGDVLFPHPGGCVIGKRPIDLFLESFEKMGAEVQEEETQYHIIAPNGLKGTELFLPLQSVTVTETLMMAGTLASGTTIINNAAMEPEIQHLADFLNIAGAEISGAGTPAITIQGRNSDLLQGPATFETPPDRLEAGSFLILGALCAQELSITHCLPNELRALIDRLQKIGVHIEERDNSLTVRAPRKLHAVPIKTHEYPGFPTDLQAPIVVLLTQAEGESHVFETIFEGRLLYVEDLILMGADIRLISDRELLIHGPQTLRHKNLKSPDIRAGLAFIIAAAIAEGESHIHDIYLIDRGYEHIEKKLSKIGLDIKRIDN